MKRVLAGAIAGASMLAAVPAAASAGPTVADSSKSVRHQPSILDRAASKRATYPMVLSQPASPNVFGTVALNAGVTFYDARFRRVASTDARDPLVVRLAAGAAGLDPVAKLRWVQEEVNRKVRWAHDLENMGVADFWANAGETLRRGTGDSEDIAIVKMQALKAAGFNAKDLYLSVGRHAGRGAHVLLLARTPNGFFVLDDQMQGLLSAAQNSKFTPIMTLGQGKSWIHGRRVRKAAASGPVTTAAR
jgi:predicted transglutaminase-like cysteine proteinase